MNHTKKYVCIVCGYDGLVEPPYGKGGAVSDEICPCCCFQYGLDDYKYEDKKKAFLEWRAEWEHNGYPWFSTSTKPLDHWNPVRQLENVKKHFT